MKILKNAGKFEVLTKPEDVIKDIATAARTCYQSQDKATPETDKKLVKNLMNRGHFAMFEFAHLTVKLSNISRYLTHELVRHRLLSYAQESTRYCSYDSIQNKRNIFCKFSIEDEKDIIDIYQTGKSANQISKLYGCNSQTIINILKNNNIQIRERGDFCFSSDIVNNFEPENINHVYAQILGFLFANGNLYNNGSNYVISFKIKDIEYLQQLHFIIGGNIYPYEKEGLIKLNISSKSLYNLFKNVYGCEENKSLNLRYNLIEKNLPKEYLSSFIRGFFEGGGFIGWYKNNWKRQLTFTSGCKEFLEWLSIVLHKNCNVDIKNIYSKTKSFQLVYQGKKDIKKIVDWMYSEFSFELIMERKLSMASSLSNIDDKINSKFNNFCDKYNVVSPPFDDIERQYNYVYNTQNEISCYESLKGIYKNDDRRLFLPSNIKTEIVFKSNLRELRHIFTMRCDKFAHWEIRGVMLNLLKWCQENIPLVFDDFKFFKTEDGKEYARPVMSVFNIAEKITENGDIESIIDKLSDELQNRIFVHLNNKLRR